MGSAVLTLLTRITSVIGGGVGGALKLVGNLLTSGLNSAIQFHKEGIAFAREAGMSLNQARAYTEVLTQRTADLAAKYGITADAVKALQRNLSEATGKQIMLSNQQAEKMVQINKLVGEQTNKQFMDAMMNGMGGQLDAAQGAVSKAYATGAKQGLIASKFAEKVAQNLSMANRLSFRNGIDGVTKMVALSEKLGVNMQSVESAANNFMEIDKAIENSARLQMLGGSAAAQFGNPLTASFEANYDPEAFAKRMSDSLASYAEFDSSKGYATINGMNMDFIRNIAQAMGISTEEASKMAKKNAEVKYKENRFMGSLGNMSEDKRNFILNTSQITRDANGREQLTVNGKNINEISEKEWSNMMSMEGKSDSDIMKDQAIHLQSIDETIQGYENSLIATFAQPFNKSIGELQGAVRKIGDDILAEAKKLQPNISNMLTSLTTHLPKVVEWTGVIVEKVGSFLNFITKNWPLLIAAIVGKKLLGGSIGGKLARNVGGKALNLGKGLLGKTGGFVKSVGKNLTKGKNLLKIGKGGLGAIGGWIANTATDWAADRGLIKKGSGWHTAGKVAGTAAEYAGTGAMIGSVIPGIGTAAGGVIGGAIGAVKGYMDAKGTDVKEVASKFWDGTKEKFSQISNSISEAWPKITESVSNSFTIAKDFVTSIPEKLKNGVYGMFDKVLSIFKSGKEFISNILPKLKDAILNMIPGVALAKFVIKKVSEKHENGGIVGNVSNPAGEKIMSVANSKSSVTSLEANKFTNGGIVGNLNNLAGEKIMSVANSKSSVTSLEANKFTNGGIVGGNSFSGDNILARLNSNELVLNTSQQNVVAKELSTVKAKPVGGREYIYTPRNSETTNINGSQVTVKDFNVNISGTIRLDGGNTSKNIDVRQLLNDYSFLSSLKDIIKESINTDMNNGRFLNDFAVRRGQTSSSSIVGKN